jgi:hypothetical protein
MPWFPDFVGAVELARQQARAVGIADPASQYVRALDDGDPRLLQTVWPGEVVILDPRAGEVRGHRQLRQFIKDNHAWFAGRHGRTQRLAATCSGGRAVLEVVATLDGLDGDLVVWPVAVVAASHDDRSVVFRTYCSQWPVDGSRHVRPAFLPPGGETPADVVGRHLAALEAGDTDAVMGTFAPGGYLREAVGPDFLHDGAYQLRAFFDRRLREGGIGMQYCQVTDDGVRCAVEYNVVAWGPQRVPPQAGLAVYERAADGLLAAARLYDDVVPPGD